MEAPRTPAQWFALVIGAALAAVGALALIAGSTNFGTVAGGAGEDFAIWRVSGWETVLYMGLGVLGIVAAARVAAARGFAALVGALFAVMAVWGFADGNEVMSIFAVDTADNVTYALLGGLGLLLAFMPPAPQRDARADHLEPMDEPGHGSYPRAF